MRHVPFPPGIPNPISGFIVVTKQATATVGTSKLLEAFQWVAINSSPLSICRAINQASRFYTNNSAEQNPILPLPKFEKDSEKSRSLIVVAGTGRELWRAPPLRMVAVKPTAHLPGRTKLRGSTGDCTGEIGGDPHYCADLGRLPAAVA